jgi:hypothetical protein
MDQEDLEDDRLTSVVESSSSELLRQHTMIDHMLKNNVLPGLNDGELVWKRRWWRL